MREAATRVAMGLSGLSFIREHRLFCSLAEREQTPTAVVLNLVSFLTTSFSLANFFDAFVRSAIEKQKVNKGKQRERESLSSL